MIERLLHIVGIGCLVAAASPALEQTALYTSQTHDCRLLQLATWSHPTKQVLQDTAVVVQTVQLCNNDRYPIFTLKFRYDPRGLTTDWFHRLYARMAQGNGNWPFSFVDVSDGVIVNVAVDHTHDVHVSYEDFKGQP